MLKGRRKERTTPADNASRQHRTKGTTTGWNNKEDKSLRGTTKLVCVIPVIKTKKSIETISSQRMIDLQGWQRGKNRIQYGRPPQEETSTDDRKKRMKNRKSNKNNHTTRRKQRE